MLRRLLARLFAMLRHRRLDAELDEEIEAHLALATEEYMREGMMLEAAQRAARKSFGGVEQVRQRHREARGFPWLEGLGKDLELSARTLVRERGFATTVVLTLAIGIGANAAIISVVDAVLLRPLPYPDSERVVSIGLMEQPDPTGLRAVFGERFPVHLNGAGVRLFREENRSFRELGAYLSPYPLALTGSGEPVQVAVSALTNSAFDVLAVAPRLGRLPSDEEDVPGAPRVALLSHDLWSARFGSDPQVIGRTIELNDTLREVIGVMPPDFAFPEGEIDSEIDDAIDVWIPLRLDLSDTSVPRSMYHVTGRLRSDVTPASASADVARLIQRLPESGYGGRFLNEWFAGVVSVRPLKEDLVGQSRGPLLVILGAVSFVLLIALSNITTLFIVRSEERAQQRAVRAALGASRQRLLQYATSEALLLAMLGGLAGLMLAFLGTRALIAMAPPSMPRLDDVEINRLVLGYVAAVSAVAGVVFAALPMWGMRSTRWLPELAGAGQNTMQAPERARIREGLVAAQVALAVVLLIGSGLMVRSYAKLRSVDPGFDPQDVITFGLMPPATRYSYDEAVALYSSLVERLGAVPGVRSAAVTTSLPLMPLRVPVVHLDIEDFPDFPALTDVRWVTPGYFETMRIPILSGRTMLPEDVNEPRFFANVALAERWGSTTSAIGRRIGAPWASARWGEITGVVGDGHPRGLAFAEASGAYIPIGGPFTVGRDPARPLLILSPVSVAVRTNEGSRDLVPALRREVGLLDSELPMMDVRSMEEVLSESDAVSRTSFTMLLLLISAGIALVLGAVGIYGVIAYSVSRRTAEIGVRVALGATSANILPRVVSVGMTPAFLGIGAGIGIALWGSRVLSALLFETNRLDPSTFLAAPGLLLLVAALACIVPAWRAITIDPVRALRSE
jgi:predicted permease